MIVYIRKILKLALLAVIAGLVPLFAQNEQLSPLEPSVDDPDTIVDLLILTDDTSIQVLDLLEQLTGRIILRRQDLPPTKINFNSRGPLTKADAILALESLLSLNGIMLTDMGERFLKAVPATNPGSHVPSLIMGSTLEKDSSQKIYAKLYELDYLVADQTTTALITPLLSPNNNIVMFPKSNALLVTDALVNLQRVELILNETDQAQSVRESVEFIKLEYIQAKDMEAQLKSLIDGSLKSYLQGNTNVTIDERTNQIILVTHPDNLDVIKGVILNIDIDATPLTGSEVFQLKQAKAEEVVNIIDEIITGQRKEREDNAKTVKANNQGTQNQNNRNNQNPTQNNQNNKAATGNIVTSNASLQFSEFVGLAADERTNSIVAYGTQQDLKTLKVLIEKIDIPLPQVRIEAIITEVTLGEDQSSGMSVFNAVFNDSSTAANSGGILTLGKNLTNVNTGSATDGRALDIGGIVTGNFTLDAILDLSEKDDKVKILSTPSIVVSHNEEGIINVSRSQPVVTGSISSATNLSSRSTIEYRDIGLELKVTPLIGSDGSVQMEIEQKADILSKEEGPSVEDVTLPIVLKREANSTITVNDREVGVLAGLQQNKITVTKNYFPLIGRLPIINKILSSEEKNYDRTELVIFIRPTVVLNPNQSQELSKKFLDNFEEGPQVKSYIDSETLRKTYMEGSRLSPKIKEKK